MTGKEMIKKFRQNGWIVKRIKGSHYHMEKNAICIPVPHHTTELAKGTEKSLLKVFQEVG
jgi:predicted RNA binding protein YcfA (HicA-like mRNA interferase family)